MPNGLLQIDILGTSFSIQADEDSAYLEELYFQYKKMVTQIESGAKLQDATKIAILAGLMLCDELQKAKNQITDKTTIDASTIDIRALETKKDLIEAEEITLRLIDKIDKALE